MPAPPAPTETPADADAPRLLVVEDDADTAAAVARIAAGLGFAVEAVGTLAAAREALRARAFAVMVLDRMLPGDAEGMADGARAIADLRATAARAGHAPGLVLVLSALGRATDRVAGLDMGADDYLPKPFDPDELRARLRALLRRAQDQVAGFDLLALGPVELRLRARTLHVRGTHVALSPREFDLLAFLMRNAGSAVTRAQLLAAVWNLHFDPGTNVVDVHVGRLRRKLEDAAGMAVIHTERGLGYVFDPGTPGDRAGAAAPVCEAPGARPDAPPAAS
ncbi:MAG: response regulator transcription factor [Rhodobacteraceae bacterium]|nr:response regulator transcription factor [Paracoccaceae bacterium]